MTGAGTPLILGGPGTRVFFWGGGSRGFGGGTATSIIYFLSCLESVNISGNSRQKLSYITNNYCNRVATYER